MKRILLLIIALFTNIALSATDPKVVYEMAKSEKAVILDVREKDEVKEGMIDEADWFPLSKITDDKNWKSDLKKLAGDKKIFLHCRSGRRSEKARLIFQENGIEAENIGGYEELQKILPTKKPELSP